MPTLNELEAILPRASAVNSKNHLVIGGCDAVELAAEFGTPLYVFDEATLRNSCRDYVDAFQNAYPDTLVIYAAKAFINRSLALIIKEEGLGLDVVSGGELAIARSVEFPPEKIFFHGNNKQPDEIEEALSWRIGRFVIDNLHELSLVNELVKAAGIEQPVLLRLTPGIDAHTHQHITTGILDSKFGLPTSTGQAEEALREALSLSNVKVTGFHAHLGSLIFSAEPYVEAIGIMFDFAARMKSKYGVEVREFSPGGGFAVQYTRDCPAPPAAYYAKAIADSVRRSCSELNMSLPRLIVEPGRAIVARAAIAIYRVGTVKLIPGVRKYVAVDGGMADNIRPVLYGSRYEALAANKVNDSSTEKTTLAGKFCESGDVLARDIELPSVEPGDLIVVPAAGAYCIPLASNYNASLKPAVIMVSDGRARVIRRRESYSDLMRNDVV